MAYNYGAIRYVVTCRMILVQYYSIRIYTPRRVYIRKL